MKKIILIVSILFAGLLTFAQGQYIQGKIDEIPSDGFVEKSIFTYKTSSSENYDFSRDISEFTLADVQLTSLQEVVNSYEYAIEVKVPFEGSLLTLQLMKSNFITDKTIITTQNSFGKNGFNYKFGAYYMGVVKGIPNSYVGISFFDNDIIGLLALPEGNVVIGRSNTNNLSSTEYIIYNDKYLKVPNNTSCGLDQARIDAHIPKIDTKKATRTITTNCVKFYVECDYKTYQDFGNSVANTTNFATGLFNLVSTLYINDSVSTSVNQVNVWTASDPYAGALNTGDALDSFSNQMSGGFNGDLAHLLSRRSLGGGIAWLDVLCDPSYYRCGVSASLSTNLTPLPTYSWNTMVVTHESGHNMASKHTHACAWNGDNTRIDNCAGNYNIAYQEGNCNSFPPNPVGGGTIMSYCHLQGVGINLSLGFGPQPGALIRLRVNSGPCLSECINCSAGITITGNYSDTLKESNTWIKSAGQTTIVNTAKVKLDPNPYTGYALFLPANNNDFFLSSPIDNNAFFVVRALDGCSGNTPQRPGNDSEEGDLVNVYHGKNAFNLYPNPASDGIHIQNEAIQDEQLSYEVYSIDGKILDRKEDFIFNTSYVVDLKNYSRGMYFMKITHNGEIQTIKFQKY